jgi:two-component system NtrC family sensor kinase
VPILLLVFVGFAAHAVHEAMTQEKRWSEHMRDSAQQVAVLIEDGAHHAMLRNRRDELQQTLRKIAGSPGIAGLRIYDKQGEVVFSSRQNEIGNRVDMHAEACALCHRGSRPLRSVLTHERVRRFVNERGEGVLGFIEPISNAPECATAACHAHPPSQTILGILDVQLSTAQADSARADAQGEIALATLLVVLIVGAGVVLFVQHFVRRPVRELERGAERVASGDLDAVIRADSHDELGDLAHAFNLMTGDLRRSRQELTAWSQQLEDKVAEKTAELSLLQRQQVHTEKMASLGKLSAVVAHELNNPLGGILTYAKLVERKLDKRAAQQPSDDASEIKRYLGVIQSESMRCGDIVRNLLLFARRSPGARQPAHVNELVQRTAMLVRHQFDQQGSTLEVRPLDGDDQVLGDQSELLQAILVLVINAMEVVAQERGRVVVSVEGDAERVAVAVEDQGGGIAPDILPHIFEPFFSTKEKGGHGIGLAVAYGIAQRHGGEIEVDSAVGRGSTFRLRLLRNPPAAEQSTPAQRVLEEGVK